MMRAETAEQLRERSGFARRAWTSRLTRGALFVLPPVVTVLLGTLAFRHETVRSLAELGEFARAAELAGEKAGDALVAQLDESRKQTELSLLEATRQAKENVRRRKEEEAVFRAAVAADNACRQDSDCTTNPGQVLTAFPKRRGDELRQLPGGRPPPPRRWEAVCGTVPVRFAVCEKRQCALRVREVAHPPCFLEDPMSATTSAREGRGLTAE